MNKKLLLSTLLGVVTAFSIAQGAHAATSASQTVTGILLGATSVIVNPASVTTATIDPTSGTGGGLMPALSPSFIAQSNSLGTVTKLQLTATAGTTGGQKGAFGIDASNNYYIALANTTVVPTAAALTDALTTPTATGNYNVIAYSIPTPILTGVDGTADLGFESPSVGQFSSLNTTTPLPASAAYISTTTFSTPRTTTWDGTTNDQPGFYQANLTLSYL